MKCKVCGHESGKYPLCKACNLKKEKGEIIKCEKCGNWHYISSPCVSQSETTDDGFLYNPKAKLMSKIEEQFYFSIKSVLPEGFSVFAQVNLASFIERADNARYHNELFRNIDFLITDSGYSPKIAVEINDSTHNTPDRKERDEKVRNICEEAGIPVITFWTSYGVNTEYIKTKITEVLTATEIKRIHHFTKTDAYTQTDITETHKDNKSSSPKKKKGCYVATCVYGSYNCEPVWVLRRYRDTVLSNRKSGRLFIYLYYLISPTAVRLFGSQKWFVRPIKKLLDFFVYRLMKKGFSNEPYVDM